jgi:DNA-binding protein HU-beta
LDLAVPMCRSTHPRSASGCQEFVSQITKHEFFSKKRAFSPCSASSKRFNTRRSDDFTNLNLKQTMAKALSKSQIAASVAEKAQISKKTASEILDHLADLAYKNAKNSFTLPGIGKLVLVNRKARMGRNPATGETIQIPAKKVVKFRVAKAAKDAILGAKK